MILRIDYLSLDPTWIRNNERQHILSTSDRRIIELIPSPLEVSAGLIPVSNSEREIVSERHIVIFTYSDTLSRIDWDSFPDDIQIFVFGKIESKRENIFLLDFLPPSEFYLLLDTSEFVIIRGEVSVAHIIQRSVPFFWDIYKNIG